MTQIKYYGVDTGIPISQKHVLRVKENNERYSAVVMDMHSLTVERSDWCASIQDLNNFMHKYDITLGVLEKALKAVNIILLIKKY